MVAVTLSRQARELLATAPDAVRLRLQRTLEQRAKDMARAEGAGLLAVRIAAINERIERIQNTSNVAYYVIICSAVFKDFMDVFTTATAAIPFVGIPISIAVAALVSGLYTINALALLKMKEMDEEVKSHSRFYWRMFILIIVFFLDGLLPVLSIFPMTTLVAIFLYMGIRRERKKEIARLQDKLVQMGVSIRA